MQDKSNPNERDQQPKTEESQSVPSLQQTSESSEQSNASDVQSPDVLQNTVEQQTVDVPAQNIATVDSSTNTSQDQNTPQSTEVVQSIPPDTTPSPAMPISGEVDGTVQLLQAPTKQKNKNLKKLLLIIAIVAGVVLASLGGVLAYLSTLPTPQERLQSALVNAASVQGVQQDMIVTSDDSGTNIKGTLSTQSDFSDPAVPKSKGTLDLEVAVYGITVNIKNEFICVSEEECYVKYNDISLPEELSSEKPAFLGQWLQFNPQDETDAQTADPFQLITSGVNTVLGEVISGNITGAAKEAVARYAANGTTYAFSSYTEEEQDGKTVIKYDIALNQNEILDLNQTVADQYKISNPFKTASNISERASLWVDKANNTIVKASVEENNISSTINFSKYGEKPEITAPDKYLKPSEYTSVF